MVPAGPEHAASIHATLDAVTAERRWLFALEAPELADVTDTLDRKLEALRSHESQHPDPDRLEALLRSWLTANAKLAGLPEGRLAEGFLGLETR